MVCRLFGPRPLSEPMLKYCHIDPKGYISMTFFFKLTENIFENVFRKMAVIVSRLQYHNLHNAYEEFLHTLCAFWNTVNH